MFDFIGRGRFHGLAVDPCSYRRHFAQEKRESGGACLVEVAAEGFAMMDRQYCCRSLLILRVLMAKAGL